MLTMYKGMTNSPETTITNNISNSDTLIYVLDPTRVPSELPNLMTLGTTSAAETVKVISVDGNALTVERGFQGAPAAWNAGTVIARNFTEYDYNAMRQNITELEEDIGDEVTARAAADDLKVNISDIIDGLGSTDPAKPLSAKQGKALNDLISSHKADLITDSDGAHGFKQEVINFTPVLLGSTTAGSPVYTTQYGRAVRQGNLIHFILQIQISNKGGMAGYLRISGFPIAGIGSTSVGIPIERIENWTKPTALLFLTPTFNTNTTVELRYSTAAAVSALQASDVSDTFSVRLSGTYEIA